MLVWVQISTLERPKTGGGSMLPARGCQRSIRSGGGVFHWIFQDVGDDKGSALREQ